MFPKRYLFIYCSLNVYTRKSKVKSTTYFIQCRRGSRVSGVGTADVIQLECVKCGAQMTWLGERKLRSRRKHGLLRASRPLRCARVSILMWCFVFSQTDVKAICDEWIAPRSFYSLGPRTYDTSIHSAHTHTAASSSRDVNAEMYVFRQRKFTNTLETWYTYVCT